MMAVLAPKLIKGVILLDSLKPDLAQPHSNIKNVGDVKNQPSKRALHEMIQKMDVGKYRSLLREGEKNLKSKAQVEAALATMKRARNFWEVELIY